VGREDPNSEMLNRDAHGFGAAITHSDYGRTHRGARIWPVIVLALVAIAPDMAIAQPQPSAVATKPAAATTPPAATKSEAEPRPSDDPYAGLDHGGTPPLPPKTDRLQPPKVRPGNKRKAPSYDGRGPARLTAGEVLVWVPRILFLPVYVTLEYLIRWPLVNLITLIEKYHLIEYARGVLGLGTKGIVLFPTIFVDFSRFASAGFYFKAADLGVKGHQLVIQAGAWSGHWYHAVVKDRFNVFAKDEGKVTLRTEFIWRPDYAFHGLGPDTLQKDESFFRQRITEVELSLHARMKDLNRLYVGVLYRNVKLEAGQGRSIDHFDPDPAARLPWDANDLPGYGQTYDLMTAKLQLDLDSRRPERIASRGSGIRMEMFGSYSVDPGNTNLQFAQWGYELAGFWDVTGHNHVLAFRMYLAAQEQIGDDPLPISERLLLGGGTERLRGFLEGRFRGDSALLFTVQYRYPIWSMLDANLFLSMGNVFTGRFEDFSFRRLAMSWGIALRTNTSRDVSFDVLVAFGTNQAEHWGGNFKVDFIRVTAGINQGF
jgi:Omp85 superfamily domain